MPLLETLNFISRIQQYPALWRKEDRDFNNREVRKNLYELISSETGIPAEKCKTKLKGLKDRMREICHRLPRAKSGEPAFHIGERLVNWPYYKHLLFMSDQFLAPAKDGTGQIFLSDDYKVKLEDHYSYNDYDEAGEQIEFVNYNNDSVDVDSNGGVNDEENGEYMMDSPTEIKEESVNNQQSQRPSAPSSSNSKTSFVRRMKRQMTNSAVPKKVMVMSADAAGNDESNDSSKEWDVSYYSQNYPPHNVKVKPTFQRITQMSHFSMWEAFAADITNDLSLVTDPLLQIETKAKIRRIVEQAVQDQLREDRNRVEKEKSSSDKNDCGSSSNGATASATHGFCGSSPSHPS